METLRTTVLVTLAALASLTPLELRAQERCVASTDPVEIAAGEVAARVDLTLSQPIGEVTSFDGGVDSGLKPAAPEDLRPTEMASDTEPPAPIRMSEADDRVVTLWLNSVGAEPGEHDFGLLGSDGECLGALVVVSSRSAAG